ncbi:MAG: hypothetical protein ACI8TQ_000020 [Planctomycetota bacterium]|jgi:hypothetical protein
MLALKLLLAALTVGPVRDVHLDFERLVNFQMPSEWQLGGWGYAEGFRCEVSGDAAHSGQYALKLDYQGEAEPEGNGSVFRKLIASEFHGKRVVFRAAIRVMDEGASARMLLRGKTRDKQDVLLAGTIYEPIRNSEWKIIEIFGDVRPDIEELEISITNSGRGRVMVDDIELKSVADLPRYEVAPPRSVGERELKNYIVLGRLLGLLRYYHPSDQAVDADWAALTRAGVLAVNDADDSAQLSDALEANFASVAPTLRIFAKGKRPSRKQSPELDKPTDGGKYWAVRWTHTGVGGTEYGGPLYASERERLPFEGRVPRGWLKPEKPADFDVGANVIARVPTTLYADEKGTFPHVDSSAGDGIESSFGLSASDRSTRIATVILAWNAIQHFAPKLGEDDIKWEAALETAIVSAVEDDTEEGFLSTLRKMAATLADGLVRFDHRSEWRVNNIPICWDWVEGKLIVTRISDSADSQIGLNPGDAVLQIGGRSADEMFLERCGEFSGASQRAVRELALISMRRLKALEPVKMRINSARGKRIDINYTDPFERGLMRERRPKQNSELKPGVFYCDLSVVTSGKLPEVLSQLESAKFVIFDVRDGLNALSRIDLVSHLIGEQVKDIEWQVPTSTRPNREKNKLTKIMTEIEPSSPRLAAETIFLCDGSVMGEAEALLGIVAAAKLGKIVGEPTAGSIGLTNGMELPGGYRLVWNASLAKLPDGKSLTKDGIKPDVKVLRTIAGVTASVDEALQAALKLTK